MVSENNFNTRVMGIFPDSVNSDELVDNLAMSQNMLYESSRLANQMGLVNLDRSPEVIPSDEDEISKKFRQQLETIKFEDFKTNNYLFHEWYDIFYKNSLDKYNKKLEYIDNSLKTWEQTKKIIKDNKILKKLGADIFSCDSDWYKIVKKIKKFNQDKKELEKLKPIYNFSNIQLSIKNNKNILKILFHPLDQPGLYVLTSGLLKTEKYYIGKFLIRYSNFEQTRTSIRMVNLKRSYKNLEHYCVKPDNVCWGDFSELIDKAYDNNDLASILNYSIIFLTTPGIIRPYCNWEEWCKKAKNVKYNFLFKESISLANKVVIEYRNKKNYNKKNNLIEEIQEYIGSISTSQVPSILTSTSSSVYPSINVDMSNDNRSGVELLNSGDYQIYDRDNTIRISRILMDRYFLKIVEFTVSKINSDIRNITNFNQIDSIAFLENNIIEIKSNEHIYFLISNQNELRGGNRTIINIIISFLVDRMLNNLRRSDYTNLLENNINSNIGNLENYRSFIQYHTVRHQRERLNNYYNSNITLT